MLKSYSQFINEIQFTDTLNSYLTEKLDPSDAKKYMNIEKNEDIIKFQSQIWHKLQSHDQFIEASKRQDRLYFEFEPNPEASDLSNSQVYLAVTVALHEFGYSIVDYIKGIAKKDKNDQQIKIGKVLSKISKLDKNSYDEYRDQLDRIYQLIKGDDDDEAPLNINSIEELKSEYDSDPVRVGSQSNQDYQIVFSKHSYDIAGMSSDRGWTSCMDLYKGGKSEYVSKDIKYGTFIGYLIKANDQNIENPIGRVLAKPFINVGDNSKIIYVVEDFVYGTDIGGFRNTVVEIVNSVQDAPDPGKYEIHSEVYCDTPYTQQLVVSNDLQQALDSQDKLTDSELISKFLIQVFGFSDSDFQINSDGSVDLYKSIIINEDNEEPNIEIANLLENRNNIFPITFNYIKGDCDANELNLGSLDWAPKIIDGEFSVAHSNITELIGRPERANIFFLPGNDIKDLSGGPIEVESQFSLVNNDNLQLNDINELPHIKNPEDDPTSKALALPMHLEQQYNIDELTQYLTETKPGERDRSLEEFQVNNSS